MLTDYPIMHKCMFTSNKGYNIDDVMTTETCLRYILNKINKCKDKQSKFQVYSFPFNIKGTFNH